MIREKRYKLRYDTQQHGFQSVEYLTLASTYRLDVGKVLELAGNLLEKKGILYTNLQCFYDEWVYVIDARDLQPKRKYKSRKKAEAPEN